MRRAGIIILSWLLCSGCTPEDMDPPDAGMGVDAMPGTAGLVFRFGSEPDLPGALDDSGSIEAYIEEAALVLERVRAIGDSAPGDERTSVETFTLDWEEGEEELRFPRALPGVYSQLLGGIASYEIAGTIELEDGTWPFHISEPAVAIAFSVSLDQIALDPGMTREIEITIELSEVLRQIDWEAVPVDDEGVLRVDGDSEQITSVREKLQESFEQEDG